MSLIPKINFTSILYAIIIFLTIWETLFVEAKDIPMSRTIFFLSLACIIIIKADRIRKRTKFTDSIYCILFLFPFVYIFLGTGDKEYQSYIYYFFKIFFVCIVLELAAKEELHLSKCLFVVFIIINCIVTYYEKYTMSVLFWKDDNIIMNTLDSDMSMFRASGFLGHPVLGGFLLSIVLSFVLASEGRKKQSIIIAILILLSLLCINTRTNIVVSCTFILFLYRKQLFSIKKIRMNYLTGIILICLFCFLLFDTDLGGRLMNIKIGDNSTMARFEAFDFVKYVDLNVLLWGDLNLADVITKRMFASYIENGYIVLLLNYGLLFGLPLIILLTRCQWILLSIYPTSIRISLLLVFVASASTNTHIGHSIPWVYWFVSYYLFKPSPFKNKYLIVHRNENKEDPFNNKKSIL